MSLTESNTSSSLLDSVRRGDQDADFMRLAADDPLAIPSADGNRPSYLGALPPGPAPKEGDWFTKLREKWQDLGDNANQGR